MSPTWTFAIGTMAWRQFSPGALVASFFLGRGQSGWRVGKLYGIGYGPRTGAARVLPFFSTPFWPGV